MKRSSRTRGSSLPGCLLGMGLGLLVLQALLDVVASAHQTLHTQRLLLRRQESEALVQQLLRAVAEASRRQAGPAGSRPPQGLPPRIRPLDARSDPQGEVLEASFVADGAPGACGEAAPAAGSTHRYRLDIDSAGTLRCALDGHAPQPVVDGLGAWEFEFIELRAGACASTAASCAPRLRRVRAAQVLDWNRVVLMRVRLRMSSPAPSLDPAAAAQSWVALPLLRREAS